MLSDLDTQIMHFPAVLSLRAELKTVPSKKIVSTNWEYSGWFQID